MNEKIAALLNDQINKEFYSAYLYLDIANSPDIPLAQQHYAIKRIIKQIICAWELLMKYRLQKEDWTQIFKKPFTATDAALKSGDFKSISYLDAIERLKEHGIDMSFTNLTQLHQFRNQIEHYQIDAPLSKVLSTITAAIDELSAFFDEFIWDIADETETVNLGFGHLSNLLRYKDDLVNLLSQEHFPE